MLRRAGFTERPGKGSHTNWAHPLYAGRITVSGNDGDDAKPYLEKAVDKAIKLIEGEADG
ncbi:type II toxin-antitoxin system HicA family toxin [Candidatus Gracilibacteria bacterium]|nr:type II toxin-antitoxin system HicA family toxin [Candidatus Gracilibacteria bacterium]